MTTYNAILDTQLDPDAPLTSSLAYAWRDNPLAIAEDDVSAPKRRSKTLYGSASGASITFTGVDDYNGVMVFGHFSNSGGGASPISYQLSDDGVTFSIAATLVSVPASSSGSFTVFFDKEAGTIEGGYSAEGAGNAGGINLSPATLTTATTDIRIVAGANITLATIARPNGGRS